MVMSLGEELGSFSLPSRLLPWGKHPFEAVRANLVVTPILYVRKLRHRKVKLLVQS